MGAESGDVEIRRAALSVMSAMNGDGKYEWAKYAQNEYPLERAYSPTKADGAAQKTKNTIHPIIVSVPPE